MNITTHCLIGRIQVLVGALWVDWSLFIWRPLILIYLGMRFVYRLPWHFLQMQSWKKYLMQLTIAILHNCRKCIFPVEGATARKPGSFQR